jgi:predicted nucleotidyltransferase
MIDGKRKYGLLESDWEKIIEIFTSNPKINKVVLFGSRAKESFENGSDIDIALQGDHLNIDDILSAKLAYDKLQLPYKIDIVLFDRIKEKELIEHINRVGVILYSNKE